MTALVFDTGALVALERNDRNAWAKLMLAITDNAVVQVPAGVIAQAWRDGTRQARLARALKHCDEVPLDGVSARASGMLCAATGTSDVIDASVAVAAATLARHQPTTVLTSDAGDLRLLIGQLGSTARVSPV